MKTCPFCAEQIQAAAILCKHCGARFEPDGSVLSPARAAVLANPAVLAAPSTAGAQGPPVSGMIVTGFVMSLLWLGGIGSFLALALIGAGRDEVDRGVKAGRGLMLAGLVLGLVGLAAAVLFWALAIATDGFADSSSYDPYSY